MEDKPNPFVEHMCRDLEKILDRHFETEHQIMQKDIEIAVLNLELGLQKKSYALLRQSHANLLKIHHKNHQGRR